MSAKKVSVVRKEPSDALLQAFLEKGNERLGEVLRNPDIRLVTEADRRALPPSPATTLQEQVVQAVQQSVVTEAPQAAPAPVLIAAAPAASAVVAPAIPAAPAATIVPQQPPVTQQVAEPAVITQPAVLAQPPVVEHAPPEAITVPPQAEEKPAAPSEPAMPSHLEADAMSLEVPTVDGSKAQHLYGRRGQKAVDFNLSLTQEQADRLNELTAYEMLRTRSKHSISEIVRHLVDFALHHVEENRVIPTADGLGLHKQPKGA